MATILTNCADKIVEKIVDLTIGEARHLCCFKCIVRDFEKEKEELMSKWKTDEKYIEEARNRGEEIRDDVEFLHGKAHNIIKEKTEIKRKFFFGYCPNYIWQYLRGKELAENTKEVRRLRRIHFGTIGFSAKLPGVEYYASEDFIDFESRNLVSNELMEALKDGENYMVGLYGMGGTGKTTLVQKVGNEVKKEQLFNEVVFSTVSNDPDIRKIQDDIAIPLGLKLDEGDELRRAKKLWSRLTNGQKILVILDDVWNVLKLEDIGIPSSNNHSNCKVLLTSRNLSICKSKSCQKIIELQLLSEKDASILFGKNIGLRDDWPKSLRKLAQQIANECKRLPIAITVIAKSLKDQPPEVWKATLKSLKEFKQLHSSDEMLKIYNCFRVSYDNLKDEQSNKLFLLCSLFPEDHEISLEDLVRFANGLGLFGEVDSYEAARINMLTAKRKLLDCCLLLQGQQGCVKMHDLVLDAAHWISNNEIQVILGPKMNKTVKWSTIKHLYCHNIKDLPNQLDCTKLEILILVGIHEEADYVKLLESIFERMKNLRVLTLDLGFWRKPKLDMIPSIRSLNNIRTLCLRHLNLGDISIVEKLKILETLELRNCSINDLPNGIVELKKLRLFSLIDCKIGRSPYKVIGKLSQIEELYFMRITPEESKWEFDEETFAYFHGKDSISRDQLQRYHIMLNSSDSHLSDLSVDDSISRCLSITYFDPSNSNATIKDLVQRAEILHLWNLQGVYRTVTPHLVEEIRGDINDLIELQLHFCSKIECLIDTTMVGTVFSKLKKITLEGMDHLKELCHGQRPPCDFFDNLQELSIFQCFQLHGKLFVGNLNLRRLAMIIVSNCPKLTSLFTPSTAQSLMLLETLEIRRCDELKYIITNEREKAEGKEIIQHELLFPKLETLLIEGCNQMEFVFPVCTEWSAKRNDAQVALKKRLLNPTTLLELQRSNLQSVGSFDTVQCLMRQSRILSNVRKMELINCQKMTSLFTLLVGTTIMLEELKIDNCNGLKHVITYVRGDDELFTNYNSVFPKLRKLIVKNCCDFEYMLGQYHHKDKNHNIGIRIDLPALEEIFLKDLPNIMSICPNNYHVMYPSLKVFSVEECPQFLIKSISDIMVSLDSQQLDGTTPKDLGVILNHLRTLECINVGKCKIDGIFCTELPINGQQVSSVLQSLKLYCLLEMRYLCKGPKYFLILQNLKELHIDGCPKLQVIFSASISRSLPELKLLMVEDCTELERIIEEDDEIGSLSNPDSPQVCFPKLTAFFVRHCDKLKRLLSISTSYEFPMLEHLIVAEASQLEEVFGHERGKSEIEEDMKDVFPKLKFLVLVQLPNLATVCQGVDFQTIENSVVIDCSNITLNSTTNLEDLHKKYMDFQVAIDYDIRTKLAALLIDMSIDQSSEGSTISDIESPTSSQSFKEPEREVIGVVSATEIPAMTAIADLEVIKMASSSSLAIHLHGANSNQLVDENSMNETSLMLQEQSIKESAERILHDSHKSEKAIINNSEPRNQSSGSLQKESTQHLVGKKAINEPIRLVYESTPETRERVDKPSDIEQNVEEPANGSVFKATSKEISSRILEWKHSSLTAVVTSLDKTSPLISSIPEINAPAVSSSISLQRMSRNLLEELSDRAIVDNFASSIETSGSSLVLWPELQELKTELAEYLNMSLEAICDNNALDNVESIVKSLAKGTTDAIQKNILEDFISRLKSFKECVPKAMSTMQSSLEFISNYENLNVELNTKLNEEQEMIRDLESKLSEASSEEYTIEKEIQRLITRKIEIHAEKISLASILDHSTQAASKDYEKWKALGEELKLSTDRWLRSKEDLAHANASWKIFKEVLEL